MQYKDKSTGKIVDLNDKQVAKLKELKLLNVRYTLHKEKAKEKELKPGNITKPSLLVTKPKK